MPAPGSCASDVRRRMDELADPESPDDAEFLAGLLRSFVLRVPSSLVDVQEAVAQGDTSRIERIAHGLKGSALNLGAESAGAVCAELEAAGRRDDLGAVQALLGRVDQELFDACLVLSDVAGELERA